MAWQDVLQRYRGSVLGPLWQTLSMAIMISVLGLLYSKLFKMDINNYLPYLCLGILVWSLISQIIIEGCQTFLIAEPIIKQIRMPFSIHAFRVVWRNLIVAAHNFIVYIFVALWFGINPGWGLLTVLPSIALIAISGFWMSILLGMACTRFRDVPQIVSSLTQVIFFVTPIIWDHGLLGADRILAEANPFFAFIEILRAPLLGQPPSLWSWALAVTTTLAGASVTMLLFVRFRPRIPYWC